MALPSKTTRAPRLRTRQSKNLSSLKALLALVLSMAVCGLVFYQSFRDSEALVNHQNNNNPSASLVEPSIDEMIYATTLASEHFVYKTLKQCLPQVNTKCKTFIPENSGQRIALLTPPGDLATRFSTLVRAVISRAEELDTSLNIDFIPTTHIAPYGYGKTHGWTKIIRIVPVPLLSGVSDTLFHLTTKESSISLSDVKSNLRQQIRYHCRLSHVAAHTSLWTLTTKELSELSLKGLTTQIQEFLGLPTSSEINLDAEQEPLLSSQLTRNGYQLLQQISFTNSTLQEIETTLNNIVLDELQISKNLSAWPCQSFWTVGEGHTEEFSPLIQDIAKSMSPDCGAPFTSCFVKRDKCEANGDGACA